eukprot:g8702.t1
MSKLLTSKYRLTKQESQYVYRQYHIVGRHFPTEKEENPPLYRMKIWAKNHVAAKSKFWYFLRKLKRVKKGNGQVISCTEIMPRRTTVPHNYGIWIRVQSRTGYHNMYKEYRDVTLNGAVLQMYMEMSSRHRIRAPQIQIIRTAELTPSQCKRARVKQFHNSKIKFPIVRKLVRAPLPSYQKLYESKRPHAALY